MHHFSTLQFPKELRLKRWNEFNDLQFPGLSTRGEKALVASIAQWPVEGLLLANVRIDRAVTTRPPAPRKAEEEPHAIDVYLQIRGHGVLSQSGRHGVLYPGDLSFCTNDEPFSIATSDGSNLLVVHVPTSLLTSRWEWFRANSALIISGKAPAASVYRNFVESIWRQGPEFIVPGPDAAPIMQALVSLMCNALSTEARWYRSPATDNFGTRERILEIIQRDLFLPELGSGTIAAELGISTRAIQNIFARTGTTATRYITDLRLDIAAKQLELVAHDLSVTQIAMDLGFSDASYFARRFKAKMGLSPREYRNRMMRTYQSP